jgi:hypothetical protein
VHAEPGVAPALQDATVSSIVYEPTAGRLHAAAGAACEGALEEFGLHDDVAAG